MTENEPKIETEKKEGEHKCEGHDHHHDHDHDHDHDNEMPELENPASEAKKLNRGEKKCRKALLKLGMKQITGITRVTLKKREGLIFVVNDPEVLKSGTSDSSYAIFGELKLEDPNMNLPSTEAQKFGEKDAKPAEAKEGEAKKEAEKKEDEKEDEEPLNEEGLTPNHIDMVMQHANCSRNKAIRALREANDDMVNAIMHLTQ